MPQRGLCFYCGCPATSREHAIPKWIPKHLKQTHLTLEHVQAHHVVRRKMIAFADYAGYILCEKCNHHALRPRENDVKPLLIPIMDGEDPRAFEANEQEILAGWGAKVAYNLLAIERKRRGVPKAHRTYLLRHATPVRNCLVAYGRYSAGGVRIFAGRARLTPHRGVPTDKIVFVHHATVAFGQVALRVYGIVNPQEGDRFRLPVGKLIQVWPPRDATAHWPPLWTLDDRGIDELARYNHYIRR